MVDNSVVLGSAYDYRVFAANLAGRSVATNAATASVALPPAPVVNTATAARSGSGERITVTWGDVPGETGYTVQWSATSDFAAIAGSGSVAAKLTSFTSGNLAHQVWYVRVVAVNVLGASLPSEVLSVPAAL